MMSWDLVFWANKVSVDYVPSSWAVDEQTYKWPRGVSQEVRQGLIDICDPLINIKYRISKGIARKKGITDLQKAKILCEKALYTSSVDTSDVDSQELKSLKQNASLFTPPITKKLLVGQDSSKSLNRLKAGSNDSSIFLNNVEESSNDEDDLSPPKELTHPASKSFMVPKNSEESSDDDEDIRPLTELAHPGSKSRKTQLTATRPAFTPPNVRKSLFEDNKSVKRQKGDSTASTSVLKNGNHELTTDHTGSVTLTDSEKLIFKEIKKLNWEIADMKKTVYKIHDILLTNRSVSGENGTEDEELWQLPIENQTLLESLEQNLREEKNVEVLGQRLYLCGGETTHKAVFLSMKKLFSREVAILYSGTGKKGKLSFQKLSCYRAVIKAIRKRFPNATDAEINKSISLYLAGAGDREGGRKNR